MNTIELAYQPFAQVASPSRFPYGWALVAVAVALLAVMFMCKAQTDPEHASTDENAS